ncbi:MAG: hypothetical protein RLZZ225_417, partial [Pseudomonadota bacterium]
MYKRTALHSASLAQISGQADAYENLDIETLIGRFDLCGITLTRAEELNSVNHYSLSNKNRNELPESHPVSLYQIPRQFDDGEDMKKLMDGLNALGTTLIREVTKPEEPKWQVKEPLRDPPNSNRHQTRRQKQSNLDSDRCVNCSRKRKYPTLFSNKPEPLDGERA